MQSAEMQIAWTEVPIYIYKSVSDEHVKIQIARAGVPNHTPVSNDDVKIQVLA